MIARLWRHLPVALSAGRLVAAPLLVPAARHGASRVCSGSIITLIAVDIGDGMLARRLGEPALLKRQRRWDGAADAVLYLAAPLTALLLCPARLRSEAGAITLLAVLHGCNLLVCLLRFRRLPRYRSGAFRWSSGALGLALAGCTGGWLPSVGLRIALLGAALAHLDALAITLLLDRYRQPIPSAWSLVRSRGSCL